MSGSVFNTNGVLKEGGYVCNIEKDMILSNRIYDRNVPSAPLAPQFSMRPASTKYSYFPVVDPRPPAQLVPIETYPTYSVKDVFNPGDAQAPWSGFASNIDKESTLRNQFFALQHCDQKDYVPSTKSDMYESIIPVVPDKQNHPLLFKQEKFNKFDANPYGTGKSMFYNHTRQELKNVKKCP